MSKDILYYPTIKFKKKDYEWLWRSALLWDRIYRIVPKNYSFQEPLNIEKLCSEGDIGFKLYPEEYKEPVSKEFVKKLKTGFFNFSHFNLHKSLYNDPNYEPIYTLHKEKLSYYLFETLKEFNLSVDNGDWIKVPAVVGNFYMSSLASYMAEKNKLALSTGDNDSWKISALWLNKVEAEYEEFERWTNTPPQEELVSLFINDIFPTNILDLTPEEILKFRKKRKDERKEFIDALENFRNRLSGIADKKIIKDLISEEQKKVEFALNQYKKSMDILGAVKFSGGISSLISLAASIFAVDSTNPVFPITAAFSAGVGFVAGFLKKYKTPNETPYSYLIHLKKLMPIEKK